jgi:hypothetical protein
MGARRYVVGGAIPNQVYSAEWKPGIVRTIPTHGGLVFCRLRNTLCT